MSDRTLIATNDVNDIFIFDFNSVDSRKANFINKNFNGIYIVPFIVDGKDDGKDDDWGFSDNKIKEVLNEKGLTLPFYQCEPELEDQLGGLVDSLFPNKLLESFFKYHKGNDFYDSEFDDG